MFSENQGVVLTIIIVILICIAALVGVLYTLITTLRDIQFGEVTALSPDRDVKVLEKNYNYNFAIPDKDIYEGEARTSQPVEPQQNQNQNQTYNYNFDIPQPVAKPNMVSIQIPSIRYDSPIIVNDDGNYAVDRGAWWYPTSNHPFDGEAIFLCHRRYFKAHDPKSCWNLDKVKEGSSLYINFDNQTQAQYQVISVAVAEGTDMNVYNTSEDKLVKLISCSMENGKIGSDSHRIIVIARQIS